MNPLIQLIDSGKLIHSLEQALNDAKTRQREAKKALLALCPVQVGDKVPMDEGGYGEVYRIRIMSKRYNYVSYGVDLSKDGEHRFLTMVPSKEVMDRLRA